MWFAVFRYYCQYGRTPNSSFDLLKWEHSTFLGIHHYLFVKLILSSVVIFGKVFKGSSKIDFPSNIRLCVSQQLSWGLRAFYVLVCTRFDTISFCCWMWDKINSCHFYGIHGEICGLNFLGWLWQSPWQPGNVFIKDNTVVFHLFLSFASTVFVNACAPLCGPVFGCDVCTCYPFPGIFVHGAPHWPNKPVKGDVWRSVHM